MPARPLTDGRLMRSTVRSVLLSVLLVPVVAGAADVAGFDGQRFAPAAGTAGGFTVERPFVAPHLGYGFGLFLNYADDAVVTRDATGEIAGRPLDSAASFDLLASLALFDFLELGVDLPLHALYEGDPLLMNGRLVTADSGIGDLRLVPKLALGTVGGRARYAIGLAVPITLPTGNERELRGDGVVTAEPKLLLGMRGGRLGVTLNGGVRLRPGRQPLGQEVTFGGAAQLAVFPRRDLLDLTVEATGGAFLDPDLASVEQVPLEVIAGVVAKPSPSWEVYLGGGPGLTDGLGAANYRVVAGIRFTPRPTSSSYADGDGDGNPDFSDRCPRQAEDADGFQDGDGCPEDDNDRDGIADDDDECPDEAEDPGGGARDGCPDGVVTYRENRITVRGKVQFETGSARLKPESQRLLDQVASILRAHPEIRRVRVEGHTDDVGPALTNKELSERRADSVRDALVRRGIAPSRLSIRGYGESRPIAPNKTKAGRAKNRRVEFVITG
ncbi:OmpA/MotB domain protein [Anaeromyxobacter sp. Fw109-5]|nr:OmpA/MotB domain protein [Anaeromyxobacter sp. Fw109-5]